MLTLLISPPLLSGPSSFLRCWLPSQLWTLALFSWFQQHLSLLVAQCHREQITGGHGTPSITSPFGTAFRTTYIWALVDPFLLGVPWHNPHPAKKQCWDLSPHDTREPLILAGTKAGIMQRPAAQKGLFLTAASPTSTHAQGLNGSLMSNSCHPMGWSPPGSSVQGILQARIMEWVAIPSSRGSSPPRDPICISCVSCIGRWIFLPLPHLESP